MMSETGTPPPAAAMSEEQVRPLVSQPPSTSSSARTEQEPLPVLEAGDEASPGSVSSSDAVDILSVLGEEDVHPVEQQASTSSAGMYQEPQPLLVAADEGSEDSIDVEILRSILTASAARSRPCPPQPLTSSQKIQLELQPNVEAGEMKLPDPVSSSCDQNFGAVGEEHMPPVVPQLSSSWAGMQPGTEPRTLFVAGVEGSTDSINAELMSILTASAARSRPYSSQPLTSSQMIQPEMQPIVEAGEMKLPDPVSSSIDQSFGSSEVNRNTPAWWDQPSTSSAGIVKEPDWQPDIESKPPDQEILEYAQDLTMRRTPIGFSDARPPPPQSWTSLAGLPSEMQPLVAAASLRSAEFTDIDFLLDPQLISGPWVTMRPWSPQPSTKSASMMLELELKPGNTEVTCRESMSPGPAQNINNPLGGTYPPRMRSEDVLQSEIPVISSDNVSRPTTMGITSSFENSKARDHSTSPVQKKMRHWPPHQTLSPEDWTRLQMQTLTEAGDHRSSVDSNLLRVPQNPSVPMGHWMKSPWVPQPPTSVHPYMQPITKVDTFSRNVVRYVRSTSVQKRNRRKHSSLPSTLSTVTVVISDDDEPADAGSTSDAQTISTLEERNRRPLSSQPSMSSAQTQLVISDDNEPADAGSTSAAQNISGPVGQRASASREPSTSSAAAVEAEVPPVEKPEEQKNPEDSVYAHVPHNISNIPQLRGLKAGRRHGRLRRLNTQNKMNEKYGPIIQYLGPMVAEESAKQQSQQILIVSALNHFANIINQIADKYEGKTDTTGFTERLEEYTKKMEESTEKRRKCDPNATEESLQRPPSPPKLSEEEINRRLREETEAAVEALLTGDRSKENPDRIAEIIKSFQAALRPPFK